jgi:hypothetical protein
LRARRTSELPHWRGPLKEAARRARDIQSRADRKTAKPAAAGGTEDVDGPERPELHQSTGIAESEVDPKTSS